MHICVRQRSPLKERKTNKAEHSSKAWLWGTRGNGASQLAPLTVELGAAVEKHAQGGGRRGYG